MEKSNLDDIYKLLISHDNTIRETSDKLKRLEIKRTNNYKPASNVNNSKENFNYISELNLDNINAKEIKKYIDDLKAEIRLLKSELKNIQDEIIIELRTGFKTRYEILRKDIISNSKKIEKLEQHRFS